MRLKSLSNIYASSLIETIEINEGKRRNHTSLLREICKNLTEYATFLENQKIQKSKNNRRKMHNSSDSPCKLRVIAGGKSN